MVGVLRRRGVTIAKVSGGGSSIYGLGAPPDSPRGWPVPIRAPGNPTETAAEVFLADLSISTSGSYEKFFRAGGRTFSHLMDPRTGWPAAGASAVSVLAPRTIDSEAWTKAFFVNGRDWTIAAVPVGLRVLFCDDSPARSCEWIPR
jgi:FAD:protein FMN transferase